MQNITSTNTLKLSGKVAIVTGASKGIGASIAKHLAAAGAAVVVNYSSSKEGADKVVADIAAAGGKAIAVQANVAHKTEIERLFAESKEAFGQFDILVYNNTSSPADQSVYNATKSAVDGRTRTFAKELGRRKTRVNSINPARLKPRAHIPRDSWIASKRSSRLFRSAELVNRRTSHRAWSSSPHLIPNG